MNLRSSYTIGLCDPQREKNLKYKLTTITTVPTLNISTKLINVVILTLPVPKKQEKSLVLLNEVRHKTQQKTILYNVSYCY